jgi:hypothetical protein
MNVLLLSFSFLPPICYIADSFTRNNIRLLKTVTMRIWIGACVVLGLISCNEASTVDNSGPVSTVDSNTALPTDSNLPILHIDSASADTSFSIAMDSVVPDILAEDTNYHRR